MAAGRRPLPKKFEALGVRPREVAYTKQPDGLAAADGRSRDQYLLFVSPRRRQKVVGPRPTLRRRQKAAGVDA